jgi:hypothetical protein
MRIRFTTSDHDHAKLMAIYPGRTNCGVVLLSQLASFLQYTGIYHYVIFPQFLENAGVTP